MVRFIISVAAVLVAAAPAAATRPSDAIAAVAAAWAQHDASAVARQFVPDAEFVAVDGSVFDGATQIGQVFTALFADQYAGTTLTLNIVRLRVVSHCVV